VIDFNLAIIDVETTGLSASFDRIIEVGVLRVEKGEIVRTYSTLVDPERIVSPHIQHLTGITNRDLEGAPTFRQIRDELRELLDDCIFVGHNARFDYGFVRQEFGRENIPFTARCLCTARLSRALFPGHRRHNLDSIIERFGIACANRHRALDDAMVLWDFIRLLPHIVAEEDLRSTIKKLLKTPTYPSLLDETAIRALPETPGVYLFNGQDGSPLYVGKSVNIRNRVLSHFAGDQASGKERALCQQVADVKVVRTSGELGALLLESHLIKETQPLYNRRSVNRKPFVILKKAVNSRGYFFATIENGASPSITDLPDILALFRTVRQARDFLWSAARAHSLCPKVLELEKGNSGCSYRQLGVCRGACTGEEPVDRYNEAFLKAFERRAIRPWPFPGPVMIEERGADGKTGEVFLVDRWCLVGAFRFDDTGVERFFAGKYVFDLEAYRIIARHLSTRASRSVVRHITMDQLEAILEGAAY
jgi:DNA polymerase-3 subunit epsilon